MLGPDTTPRGREEQLGEDHGNCAEHLSHLDIRRDVPPGFAMHIFGASISTAAVFAVVWGCFGRVYAGSLELFLRTEFSFM